jgi:streptogramin lyase
MQVALPGRFVRLVLALLIVTSLAALSSGPLAPPPAAAEPTIEEFDEPPVDGPTGIVAGPDGNLWFTVRDENAIGKITPEGTITTYPIPTAESAPEDITLGPDGNLWFTEYNAGKIGRIDNITSAPPTITEFTVPNGTTQRPAGITSGPDGNLWFTQQGVSGGDAIGRISTDGTGITSFPTPTPNGLPMRIVAGPDDNLWFTQRMANKVARITTAGVITEYPLPACPCLPEGITAGPDGNLWVAEAAGAITRVDIIGNAFDFFPPDDGVWPRGITTGPDGALWYTSYGLNYVGRVTTTGVFDQFAIPTANSKPYAVAPGPDGNIWFTEEEGDRIGRATTEVVTLATSSDGDGSIAAAPTGAVIDEATRNFGAGDVVKLTPYPTSGRSFIGWTVDGTYAGWANPLNITMDADHAVEAIFVETESFPDVTSGPTLTAVRELASRGAIFGYQNGNYGPSDRVQRAQMAALIARAMPAGPDTPPTMLTPPGCLVADSWDCEDWGNTFTDQSGDPNLWRNAGTLQHYGVALGYTQQDCERKGRTYPCYGPTDPVSHAQTIAFVTRAMIAKGYWVAQPDAPLPYTGVPGVLATEVRTFHFYTGGVPSAPTTAAIWNGGANRGWFARALWTALNSYWGTDGNLPDDRPAGGNVP